MEIKNLKELEGCCSQMNETGKEQYRCFWCLFGKIAMI